MSDVEIDEQTRAALGRLTDNERECLRRRLRHQTAKEMALDLGISPHAVEKRLKMARAKLGLSSSLEVARLLAASDRYRETGPQAPDLDADARREKGGFTRATLFGATAMTLLVATAIVLAVSQAEIPFNEPADAEAVPPGLVVPTEAEIVHMTQTTFHHVDADHSGFIDGVESPIGPPKGPQPIYRRDADGKVVPIGTTVEQSPDELRAEFYRRADEDGDGRISYPEFHHWSTPNLARGIPAAWRDDIRRWMSPEG